jgi:hypothetical protein
MLSASVTLAPGSGVEGVGLFALWSNRAALSLLFSSSKLSGLLIWQVFMRGFPFLLEWWIFLGVSLILLLLESGQFLNLRYDSSG